MNDTCKHCGSDYNYHDECEECDYELCTNCYETTDDYYECDKCGCEICNNCLKSFDDKIYCEECYDVTIFVETSVLEKIERMKREDPDFKFEFEIHALKLRRMTFLDRRRYDIGQFKSRLKYDIDTKFKYFLKDMFYEFVIYWYPFDTEIRRLTVDLERRNNIFKDKHGYPYITPEGDRYPGLRVYKALCKYRKDDKNG